MSIENEALQCLKSHPYGSLRTISCELKDGVLVLNGRVRTYFLKQSAQEAVAKFDVRIENRIEVLGPH